MLKKTLKKTGSFLLLLLFILPVLTTAKEINVNAEVDRDYVKPGETFRFIISINSKNEKIKLNPSSINFPQIKEIRVVNNYTSSSSSYSFINGKTISSNTLKVIHQLVILDESIKSITIPSISIIIDNETYKTEPVKIYIEKTNLEQYKKRKEEKKVFLDIKTSNTNPFIYEKIKASYYLYINNKYSLNNLTLVDKKNYNNFFVKSTYDIFKRKSNNIIASMRDINGKSYREIKIFSYELAPRQNGKLELPVIIIQGMLQKSQQSLFEDDFFSFGNSDSIMPKQIFLNSPKMNLNVKSLPAKIQPQNFSGIVGTKIKVNSSISDKNPSTGEGITYNLEISGDFFHDIIETPKIKEKENFEIYEPEIEEKNNKINYKYLIIPKITGKFEIPSPRIGYFDTDEKQYKTLKPDNISINVSAGKSNFYTSSDINNRGKQLKIRTGDIYFLKSVDNIRKKFEPIIFKWWYLILLLIGLLLPIYKFSEDWKAKKYATDVAYRKRKNASKMARKWKNQAINMNLKDFYSFAYNFLFKYLTSKFYQPEPSLTVDILIKKIKQQKVNPYMINKIKRIFERIQANRFSPSGKDEKDFLIKEISKIIDKIEK